ncbi:aldose 1-epimerase [Psychroserpens algicola]|uniref:Aldose 1-epimerase n=1 Tax=Psychroserpens algicola TaxID=1719034 RepID=A0ABT0H645_9FLAO|nr:aldose 1-epimerase [Psychroserpens algicola]MCK8479816.1 aldose 1-epimerase [Psychroserpens algicola]
MFKINKLFNGNSRKVVLENEDNSTHILFDLNEGGRVESYKHLGNIIISDLEESNYKKDYASAILFPFANRIKDGIYTYNGVSYKLLCNDVENNNALHGLVYNKTFELLDEKVNDKIARVVLYYKENTGTDGFPFRFSIWLTYVLNSKGFSLSIKVKNDGKSTFPFTLGWHPYFRSLDLKQSQFHINAKEKFISDDRGIVKESEKMTETLVIQFDDIQLDDAFLVSSTMADFMTPTYRLRLEAQSKENYLQIYTPPNSNSVAIEPMVGVSDSFNNNIGLQELFPKEVFEKKWIIHISKTNKRLCNF